MRFAARRAEMALVCGDPAERCVLVIPALFDEANKLRRFTVCMMRALAEAGVASVLPDLPGCNESLAPLRAQTLDSWRAAMAEAAAANGASHVLAIRGGALVDPGTLPSLHYAGVSGQSLLRGLIRGAVLGEREAGRAATSEGLLERGLQHGLVLAGHDLGAEMIAGLHGAVAGPAKGIAQGEVGGAGLWLRAEPGEDAAQSERLAALVAAAL